MAEQEPAQVKVEPDDPEFALEQHIQFKRKQQAATLLLRRLMQEGLTDLQLTMQGTGYAFTKLALPNKGITTVTEVILDYPHLRQLDLNCNQIVDTTNIQKLKYLSALNLSRNVITDCRFLSNSSIFPYLKSLNLSNNKLKALPSLELKRIISLNLNNNLIESLEEFSGHPTLQVLQLRSNRISSLRGLDKLHQLRQLFLADNSLKNLQGLGSVPKLQKIHLRKNKVAELTNFPKIQSLQYINLRENQITKVNLISGISITVKTINLLANPVSEQLGDNTKKQVWIKYRHYNKVNKVQITQEQRQQFEKEHKQRVAQQERVERQERENRQREERQAREKAQQQATG